MPRPPRRNAQLLDLAKRGAEARLGELTQEIKYLIDLFPDVRDSFDRDELPLPFIIAERGSVGWKGSTRQPRRRRMSASARKAASKRMTRYWQNWRKRRERKQKVASKP